MIAVCHFEGPLTLTLTTNLSLNPAILILTLILTITFGIANLRNSGPVATNLGSHIIIRETFPALPDVFDVSLSIATMRSKNVKPGIQ